MTPDELWLAVHARATKAGLPPSEAVEIYRKLLAEMLAEKEPASR